jgi:hypothetical protein
MTIPTLTAEDLIREYAACLSALRVLVWRTVGRDMTAEEVEKAESLIAERERLARLLWPRAQA